MSNRLSNLSYIDEYNAKNVLQGVSYAAFSAKRDRDLYDNYNKGKIDDLSEYQLKEMEILSILEKLGYPLNEFGSYLYKEVVMYAYEKIKDFNRNKDMEEAKMLLEELNDAFSSFYHIIARDDLEIGVKTFHLYICRAIDKIDNEKIDNSLAEKIFGKNQVESNYGVQAYQIASYLSRKHMIKYSNEKVKKLSNMSDDIKLKGESK